ncbi:protease synthase and sporulation protein PAI 2 [mine drainage metagenome]|uniref:Protease synthase and sporulation protein PAI 2 n=1 Tax=mine drainage metagenome TaxID=410659 RepID=A0A1J5RVS5_9ZZZZ
MYLPTHFAQPNVDTLHALMRAHPLATLVTLGAQGQGLDANPVPLMWADDGTPHGVLRGHVARANPVWREAAPGAEALAIFHGPNAYISPSWYPSKRETGKVVPTWNYAVVHARGPLRVIDDAAWVRGLVEILTRTHEAAMPQPWAVGDAPPDYIARMLDAIVGIELALTSLQGKWKTSQNQPAANRAGVVEGLRRRDGADDAAMADWVERAARP